MQQERERQADEEEAGDHQVPSGSAARCCARRGASFFFRVLEPGVPVVPVSTARDIGMASGRRAWRRPVGEAAALLPAVSASICAHKADASSVGADTTMPYRMEWRGGLAAEKAGKRCIPAAGAASFRGLQGL
jgi:hypothetical protein